MTTRGGFFRASPFVDHTNPGLVLVTHITCPGRAFDRVPRWLSLVDTKPSQERCLGRLLKEAKVTSSNLVRGSIPSSVPHYPCSSSFLESPLPLSPSL